MVDKTAPSGVRPIGGNLTNVNFLTVAEVAAVMRVSKMSVYRLIHAGELEAVRFGRSFRVKEGAVDAYLKESFYETG
ncbi:helix-turn-helix domain-containing protein [Microlunatus antarcticus]|uniref:Excisionase family DNA binding protein n=1 Tax=Microlunatus antarcticus TaxID=53388 RepID=A0A7W5JS81_9ACTN|nr:helix-turn-helix domain-containing protein [Microlunatus antarcticus]MBB3325365.1 excisionase family DNA binding protein [Microlunatus antarcticus]